MCVVYVDNIYTIEHEIRDTTGIAIVDSTLELKVMFYLVLFIFVLLLDIYLSRGEGFVYK
jgi:hypothetical protein